MKKNFGYKLALFLAALIWGSSFFIVKNTVSVLPPNLLLAMRFSFGALALGIVFHKRIWAVRAQMRGYLWRGAALGAALFAAYCVQTFGMQRTTPGKNAFLTAVYCVLVPFIYWIVSKKRPDRFNMTAAVLCVAGIGLVSMDGDMSMGPGEALTLLGGLFYAVHMVLVARLGPGRDIFVLTAFQFAAGAVLAWVLTLTTEKPPDVWPTETILSVAHLSVFCTSVALLLQNVGQQHTDPSAAAILLSLESVFGVVFSVIFYGENVTPQLALGFVLIFISIVVSETKLSFLRRAPVLTR